MKLVERSGHWAGRGRAFSRGWIAANPIVLLLICCACLRAQVSALVYERVDRALQRGEYSRAESALRTALARYPRDPHALEMLGVVLDAEKKYAEAGAYYNKALEIDPHSVSILNNLANHDLTVGRTVEARSLFLRVLARNPHQLNARLQLARISIAAHDGPGALGYLSGLPPAVSKNPGIEILRAEALHWSRRPKRAEALLSAVVHSSPHDPRIAFSAGMTEVGWRDYAQAENWLKLALRDDPSNYDILYNLGLAAVKAGDATSAEQALNAALARRPDDADVLYSLAWIEQKDGEFTQAAARLVKAHRLAPSRPGILLLLGQVSEKLGFYGDAVDALRQYLQLRPKDAVIRREYGYALAHTAEFREGVEILRQYVAQNPRDAVGYYELGVGESVLQPAQSIRDLRHTVELDPSLTEAQTGLGAMLYRAGRTREAAQIFESVLEKHPQNSRALAELGEIELQLNEPAKAVGYLSQAAAMAPDNRSTLLRYAQALGRTGQHERALVVVRRLKRLPALTRRPYSGLITYLSLAPGQQEAQYLKNLRAKLIANPTDITLQIWLAKALLREGKLAESSAEFDRILTAHPAVADLEACAETLLAAGQYNEAIKFFSTIPKPALLSSPGTLVDFAIAAFHAKGPQPALAKLDMTPTASRQGDYYLLRAQILDAMGQAQQAAEDLTLGLRANPSRPDLYFQAALFLLKHGQKTELLALLRQATRKFPHSQQLLLTQAIVYGLIRRYAQAVASLNQIEAEWPEWNEAYFIHGVIEVGRVQMSKAKELLETAISLGNRQPLAYYNLALADMEAYPVSVPEAQKAVQAALKLDPNDPYIQSLAGKIAFEEKKYDEALEHLKAALVLWPDMIEARQTLSRTYRALGQDQKAAAQLKEVARIMQKVQAPGQAPPMDLERLLFSVPGPKAGSSL